MVVLVGGGREGSGGDSVIGIGIGRVGVCGSDHGRGDGGVVAEERCIGVSGGEGVEDACYRH